VTIVDSPLNTLAVPEVTATEYDPFTGTVLFPVESEKPPVLVDVLNTMLVTPALTVTLNATGVEPLTDTVVPVAPVTLAVPPVGVTDGARVTWPVKLLFGVIVTT
jgi:hypothetical protein